MVRHNNIQISTNDLVVNPGIRNTIHPAIPRGGRPHWGPRPPLASVAAAPMASPSLSAPISIAVAPGETSAVAAPSVASAPVTPALAGRSVSATVPPVSISPASMAPRPRGPSSRGIDPLAHTPSEGVPGSPLAHTPGPLRRLLLLGLLLRLPPLLLHRLPVTEGIGHELVDRPPARHICHPKLPPPLLQHFLTCCEDGEEVRRDVCSAPEVRVQGQGEVGDKNGLDLLEHLVLLGMGDLVPGLALLLLELDLLLQDGDLPGDAPR